MKLIILKNHLKAGFDAIGRATVSNLNLPVLGSVLIKAKNNQIKLSSTNLEIAITKTISGKIIEDGGIAVPYSVISNIINNTTSERINLETKNNTIIIKTDNYEAKITCSPEGDFPIVPKVLEGDEFLELRGDVLRDCLAKVIVAAGLSDLRPEISGVLMNIESSEVKLVATDTFRLAEGRIAGSQTKNTFEQGMSVIIPLKTSQELGRIISEEDDVRVYISQNQILFKTKDTETVSRVIEGKFPEYQAIVPKNTETQIVVNKEELSGALKLTGSLSNRVSEIRLKIDGKKVIEVYSSDNVLGENNYLVPAKTTGNGGQVIFNWKYLLDGVKSLSGEQVSIGLNGDSKAAIIKAPGDTSYFYVLMPIKQ